MNKEKICFIDKIPENVSSNKILHGTIDFGGFTYFGPGDQCEDWVMYFDSFYENTPKLLIPNLGKYLNNLFCNSVDEKDKYLFECISEEKNDDIYYSFRGYIVDINLDLLDIEFPKLWPDHCRNENDNYFFYDKNRDLYFHLIKK